MSDTRQFINPFTGQVWGNGPCHYGKEHTIGMMEDLDTGVKVKACRDCGYVEKGQDDE